MMNEKEQKVLKELKQFGYDHSIVALPDIRENEELEPMVEEYAKRSIKSSWDWYNSTDETYSIETKHETIMRFCYTIGIGMAWFWEKRKDEVDAKGLYECMFGPEGEFDMDEFIEDSVGIWWARESYEHNKNLRILREALSIVSKYYDLDDKDQELLAGMVLMEFGMAVGYTRVYQENVREPYKGDMPWHWEVMAELTGWTEENGREEYMNLSSKAVFEGKQSPGVYVTTKDPESDVANKTEYYRTFTYPDENAGVRTVAYISGKGKDKRVTLLYSAPVFDSGCTYPFVIDKIYVWPSGAEATIKAHHLQDEDFHITFYDTSYLENKDKYYEGCSYIFDIYGIAYRAKIVPEEELSFTFEGQKAIDFNTKLGKETKYDENGVPEPIVFSTRELHSLIQDSKDIPEDASFRAPVKSVSEIEYLGKKVYDVEIGKPFIDKDEEHPIHIFVAADTTDKFSEKPQVGDPIQGMAYLQGRMKRPVSWGDCPSDVLHSFDAKAKDGSASLFTHECPDEEKGQPMDINEMTEFAKKVFVLQLADHMDISRYNDDKPEIPDFNCSRNRDFWVKADSDYNALECFHNEDKTDYKVRYYNKGTFPVIAYITLYDENGNECQWLKGGTYTAKFHYGSVMPSQTMDLHYHESHDELVSYLFQAFENLSNQYIADYLHKDLDFRSLNVPDPIISKAEYLYRSDKVHQANKKAKEGPCKPVLVEDEENGNYLELHYPSGIVDTLKIESDGHFITKMVIENLVNV